MYPCGNTKESIKILLFGLEIKAMICFASIVNDMIFGYHIAMCFLGIVFILLGTFEWVIVYSLYLELTDLTKLRDINWKWESGNNNSDYFMCANEFHWDFRFQFRRQLRVDG